MVSSCIGVFVFEIQFEVKGLDEAIKKLGTNIADMAEREMYTQTEIGIIPNARRKVPIKTGALHDSIYFRPLAPLVMAIGASMPYASFQELGFFNKFTGQFTKNAFLLPAIFEQEIEMTEAIEEIIANKLR